ncbi:MAG: hypothetical protein RLZZ324_1269 [Candidatus Parcubacteria bacterium]|jgi:hypothetical protein
MTTDNRTNTNGGVAGSALDLIIGIARAASEIRGEIIETKDGLRGIIAALPGFFRASARPTAYGILPVALGSLIVTLAASMHPDADPRSAGMQGVLMLLGLAIATLGTTVAIAHGSVKTAIVAFVTATGVLTWYVDGAPMTRAVTVTIIGGLVLIYGAAYLAIRPYVGRAKTFDVVAYDHPMVPIRAALGVIMAAAFSAIPFLMDEMPDAVDTGCLVVTMAFLLLCDRQYFVRVRDLPPVPEEVYDAAE